MAGETVNFPKADEAEVGDAKREQSTIQFPYLDLDTAIEVARAMHATSGNGVAEAHELAATMNQTVSGAFRLKTGTARIFGLTEKEGAAGTKLSALGRAIIEPETEKAARAEAFMCVPLYAAIYEKYKGQRLPPMKALEREMQALGVSSKQADKARQAFERSAKQAGYKDMGDDRLVRPRATLEESKPDGQGGELGQHDGTGSGIPSSSGGGGNGTGGGFGHGQFHPLIQGLLVTLPTIGEPWPEADRKAWLTMAESIFAMIYTKGASVKQPGQDANTATGQ